MSEEIFFLIWKYTYPEAMKVTHICMQMCVCVYPTLDYLQNFAKHRGRRLRKTLLHV